jgi:hypothetical protein
MHANNDIKQSIKHTYEIRSRTKFHFATILLFHYRLQQFFPFLFSQYSFKN